MLLLLLLVVVLLLQTFGECPDQTKESLKEQKEEEEGKKPTSH